MDYAVFILIAVGIGFIALMYSLARPEAATLIVVFVLYSNIAVVAKKSHGVPEWFAGAFILMLLIPLWSYVVRRQQPLIIDNGFLLMLGYLGVLILSATFSQEPSHSSARIQDFVVEGLVLYFLVVNTVRTPAAIRGCIWAMLAAGVFMGGISLYQELTGSYDQSLGGLGLVKQSHISVGDNDVRRLAGTIGSKNRTAQALVVLLALALSRIWAERSRTLRVLAGLACIPILSGTLLTYSRGAGISILAVLCVMFFMRLVKIRDVAITAVAGLAIVLVFVPSYIDRIITVFDQGGMVLEGSVQGAGASVRGRATVQRAALRIWSENLILGVGPGQTHLHTTEYGNQGGYRQLVGQRRAHNMYVEELSDTGVVGFTFLMAIVLTTLFSLLRLRKYLMWIGKRELGYTAVGLALMLITYLASAVFLHLSYVRYYWFLVALSAAAARVLGAEARAVAPLPGPVLSPSPAERAPNQPPAVARP